MAIHEITAVIVWSIKEVLFQEVISQRLLKAEAQMGKENSKCIHLAMQCLSG